MTDNEALKKDIEDWFMKFGQMKGPYAVTQAKMAAGLPGMIKNLTSKHKCSIGEFQTALIDVQQKIEKRSAEKNVRE
jgi:hypothetical protein